MRDGLLPLLVCSECNGSLSMTVESSEGNEVKAGLLKCKSCPAVFPIVDFIPRFVSSDKYVRSFSAEWNIFSRTQLDARESREAFVNKTGLLPEKLAGSTVLEAGCGMGRFLDVVSEEPSATVVGFDLSLAVESAYANVGARRNVHIVQADIMKPPFRQDSFDAVFSIGVLHHTNNPKAAFSKLVPLLKRDGQIAIWVYLRSRRPYLSDFYRIFTSRMPWSFVLGLSKVLVKTYRLNMVSRYIRVILPISALPDPEERLLDTFDWYSPRYQFKFTTPEVLNWFRQMGLEELKVQPFPVSVSGRKL
jgi:SAM-dependent methyltransferase